MSAFALDPFHQLSFRDETGQVHCPVTLVRAFPLTAPEEHWSLVNREGEELLAIPNPGALDPTDRALLNSLFEEWEFCPEILSIDAVNSFATPSTWAVTTPQGQTELILQAEEEIRRLPGRALLITSRSGTQFTIPDRLKLDRRSRRFLDRFL